VRAVVKVHVHAKIIKQSAAFHELSCAQRKKNFDGNNTVRRYRADNSNILSTHSLNILGFYYSFIATCTRQKIRHKFAISFCPTKMHGLSFVVRNVNVGLNPNDL